MEEEIELARKYVNLSNRHELEMVFRMFDENAVYHSNSVGSFKGLVAISTMMREFFARYKDVHWVVDKYSVSKKGGVEFGFVRRSSDPESGKATSGRGWERIVFNDTGLITEIEVDTFKSRSS
ncbi:MAG: hypothetical protein DF168_02199 [Candidatus Moanabacter tarae]|uniref:SnoaL-like domain-containing protein n=1 Tax=Candidatus Moanibacter tarae TaxID=2200854 RepID=A0A2Z4AKD2_9BACT|nr:MAG: hypothetical protein DF168_02199 [Candidatus Moanabacter tarae]|tara:strand:+ start:7407 stop:7775 length:369 start_codon:yes stop_codon:yes gene_type:complete